MPSRSRRKIIKVGGSRVTALPPGWLRMHQLDAGDSVEVIHNGFVIIMPKNSVTNLDLVKRELALISKLISHTSSLEEGST